VGYGDKLMALGDAEALSWSGKRVAIGDGTRVDWCSLSEGLPFLATQQTVDDGWEELEWVHSYPSNRPYIDYDAMRKALEYNCIMPPRKPKHLVKLLGRYIWKTDYRPRPAPIVFNEQEQEIIARWSKQDFVCVEPFIKPKAPVNKQWDMARYRELIRRLSRETRVVQLSAPVHIETFPGAVRAKPESFRQAIAYLAASKGYIGAEGGLHHGAAAAKKPAVVLFGGFVDPLVTGYETHVNLTGGADHFCGTRARECPHCREAMNNISVDEVFAHSLRMINGD